MSALPPCVDGFEVARTFFTFAALVGAPVCSAFRCGFATAGHNALRGSGPDRKPAFDNAWGQLGCPDRRIDRLCITCCSSSQPSHHAGCPARSRLCRERDGFLIVLALGHDRPCHPGDLVGKRDGGDLGVAPRQQCCEPGPVLGAMDLGIADDGQCAGHKQEVQIAVTSFADTAEPVLAPLECCFGTRPIQAEKLRPDRNARGSATVATRAVASAGPTPGHSSSRMLILLDRCQAVIILSNSRTWPLSLRS